LNILKGSKTGKGLFQGGGRRESITLLRNRKAKRGKKRANGLPGKAGSQIMEKPSLRKGPAKGIAAKADCEISISGIH